MVRAILTKPYAARVSLERLSPEQSQAMVQDLLGTEVLPPALERSPPRPMGIPYSSRN